MDRHSTEDFFFYFTLFYFFVVLGVEPRDSRMLVKCTTTELHPYLHRRSSRQ
jgi:hypothetical protein